MQTQVKPLNSPTPLGKASPWTVRVAMWSAGHRWPVLILWLVFVVGLFAIGQVMGTRTNSISDAAGNLQTESQIGTNLYNAGVNQVNALNEPIQIVINHPNLKATDPAFRDTVSKIEASLRNATFNNQQVLPGLADPYTAPPQMALISPDGSSVRIEAALSGNNQTAHDKIEGIKPILENLGNSYPGYNIHTFNLTLLSDQQLSTAYSGLQSTSTITPVLTLIILLLTFGAVVAAFVPLILGLTALLGAFGFMAIYSNAVDKIDLTSSNLIVLIGLAVAVDYSLFLIVRYRKEQAGGLDRTRALEVASSTSGRAVFFSGVIVMISLAGLFFAPSGAFASIAVGTIVVVLLSVVGSLTFLPAFLTILGNKLDWGCLPWANRSRRDNRGWWGWLVSKVVRYPVAFTIVTVALLLSMASPLLHFRTGTNGVDALPDSLDGVKAYRLLNDKWPQSGTLLLDTVVTSADRVDTKAAIGQFQETVSQQICGLAIAQLTFNDTGQVAKVSFFQHGTANDQANWDAVNKIRRDIIPATFGKLPGVQVYVTGDAAVIVDTNKLYSDAIPLVFGFVLTMSFLLLLLAFHSIVIPITAILLNLLSTGAAYGAMVLVFQDGFLSKQIGFKVTGVIEAFVPIFVFAVLFGLSMDYHLFILTRIKELKDGGQSSVEAVAKGITGTSGTITSAAAIMVVVFLVFVTIPLMVIRQVGFGLAVAVFVDAAIIRSILLPGIMRLLGDFSWYLPGWLNWIPRITVEVEPESEKLT